MHSFTCSLYAACHHQLTAVFTFVDHGSSHPEFWAKITNLILNYVVYVQHGIRLQN